MRGGLEDTICAIATPAGEGGIGIVRLSGGRALAVAGSLVRLRSQRPLASIRSHTVHLADLLIPSSITGPGRINSSAGTATETLLDEALILYMKAPKSYTGEDVVEVQSHGGALVLSLFCRACVEAGARFAEPGEFTKRAFLNGRLDLSQAEAVLDTIRARSAAGLVVAQRQLRGELAREVDAARAVLLNVLAHVEAGIDFVEEDIAFLRQEELRTAVADAWKIVERLETTAREGRILREGARVVILGRPNVGKSSLMNRLLKEDRAIVTAVPGTTRDLIEESVDLDGLRVHVVDTAGLRHTEDPVEREGIRRTRDARNEADLLVIVVDGSEPLTPYDRELLESAAGTRHVVALNKADLPPRCSQADLGGGAAVCTLSAKTGAGIDRLRSEIRRQLIGPGADSVETVLVSNVRHRTALRRASESLRQALDSVAAKAPAELIAVDVRAAADALGEITGAITTDEILERIFSEFCIGK